MIEKITADEVTDSINKYLIAYRGYHHTRLTPATVLESFGMDNLDKMELVIFLEESFEVSIDDEEILTCATVQDIINLVESKKGAAY